MSDPFWQYASANPQKSQPLMFELYGRSSCHPSITGMQFEKLTGYGVIVNTSFNVRGEPIVCTPEDAYRCFMRTEMDYLVLGPFLLEKKAQPEWTEKRDWRQDYQLD